MYEGGRGGICAAGGRQSHCAVTASLSRLTLQCDQCADPCRIIVEEISKAVDICADI